MLCTRPWGYSTAVQVLDVEKHGKPEQEAGQTRAGGSKIISVTPVKTIQTWIQNEKKRLAYHPSNPPAGHLFPTSITTNSIPHRTKHTASTAIAHFNLFLPSFHLASNAKPTKILRLFGALCRLPSLPPDLPLLVPRQLECSSPL